MAHVKDLVKPAELERDGCEREGERGKEEVLLRRDEQQQRRADEEVVQAAREAEQR